MHNSVSALITLWLARLLIVLALPAGCLQYFVLTLPKTPAATYTNIDGIVVATGGQARIQTGLDLMMAGSTKMMLITGVGSSINRDELERSLKLSDQQKQIFDCCVELDITALDTQGNAAAAHKWADTHQLETVLLVTANYHLPRAQHEFSELFTSERLRYWAVHPPDLNLDKWYADFKALKLLSREFGKYILARLV